jgi:signal peptidase I
MTDKTESDQPADEKPEATDAQSADVTAETAQPDEPASDEAQTAEAPAEEPAAPAPAAPPAKAKPEPETTEEKTDEKNEESWLETAKTIVYALLIALVIRTFLFQPFNIPSGSMENTLLVGDYLFVEKYAYGYSRYSFPWGLGGLGDGWQGRIFGSAPKRGDVVVFKLPRDPSIDYIKRVIGLPGDRIQMINDRLYINDKIVSEKRVSDYVETIDGYKHHVPRYQETLPGGKVHYILDRDPDGPADNTDVYIVPAGHYFMMGDNRDNSDDSRGGVGYVPAQNLVGKAEFIFFSTNGKAHFWEFWEWPWAIRWGRLFTVID